MIGKTISHYKIISKLGVGCMGVVYIAKDADLTREVENGFHIRWSAEESTATQYLTTNYKSYFLTIPIFGTKFGPSPTVSRNPAAIATKRHLASEPGEIVKALRRFEEAAEVVRNHC